MEKSSNLVASALVAEDKKTVFINGKGYIIKSPTIRRLAGAISCLSKLNFENGKTFHEVFLANADCGQYAKAISWFIEGDASLSDELSDGTFEEIIEALETALSLLSPDFFWRAVSLTKSVCGLAAKSR
jgi:hypothetical protein